MALIPTKKIPQLTAYGAPLGGGELLEIWSVNTSRRITSRDFVLPSDSLVTIAGQGATIPGSRQLVSSTTVTVIDGGAGGVVQLESAFTGALAGNPTAQVGLTPINGVALTWMRSDAAPALNQGITPTWTGLHTFTAGLNSARDLFPFYRITETDAAVDNRVWEWAANGEQFVGRVGNDLLNAFTDWIAVDRTLNVVDAIALTSTALTWNGSAVLTAATAFANPTATLGLVAVNGIATTAMRSDGAPALSQAITPTWTAQHIFSLTGATDAAILASSAQPQVDWNEADAAANNRRWRWEAQGEQFLGRTVDDANAAAVTWIAVDRTLNVVDAIALTSTALTWNGNALLSTATAFANPTGTIGLAAVNGVATTALRSDGAPALSQAIAPTWTAQHIFSLSGATNAAILASSTQPQVDWNETDAAANNRRWRWEAQGEQFLGRTVNDANSAAVTWIAIDRTLNVVDTIALTSTALTWNGTALSTAVGANPTGTVGLAAVNGVATTFLRSDGAPVLSQAIAPTWSAQHIFSLTGTASPAINVSAAIPVLQWNETDAAADNRRWLGYPDSEQFVFSVRNDANSAEGIWCAVNRTSTTIDSVAFPATAARSHLIGTTSPATNFNALTHIAAAASQHGITSITQTVNFAPLIAWNQATAGDNLFAVFETEGSGAAADRGTISYNRAAGLTAYNTTSDQRRKKNIQSSPDQGDLIDRILVRSFDWIETNNHVDYWLVAQELHAVYPLAVFEGTEGRDWAIDPGKLVPLMVKELQSLRSRVLSLEQPGNSENSNAAH